MNLVFKMCNPNNTLEFKVAKDFLHVQMTGVGNERLLSDDEALALRDYLNKEYSAWVSVSNELPKLDNPDIENTSKPVLIECDGSIHVAFLSLWNKNTDNELLIWKHLDLEGYISFEKVTHWKPLPNPPRGKDDE